MGGRDFRPRWIVALTLASLPIWLIPALIYVGWKEAGRDLIRDTPIALRWALFGKTE